jgi:hypothetical protein
MAAVGRQEDIMRYRFPLGAAALALVAAAWLSTSGHAQTQTGQGAENPGSVKGDTQPAGSEPPASTEGAKADPSGTAAEASGPIGASPQTMPAKFSAEVAARDRIPIMARPLPLSDEQKRRIFDSVMSDTQVPVTPTDAKPATILPGTVSLSALPAGTEDEIASVRGYKYVKAPDKVLLVSPANRVVVGEIER